VADFSATLVRALFEQGVNIHVAVPDYRRIFSKKLSPIARRDLITIRSELPEEQVMTQSTASFKPEIMAFQYIQLYEKMLERPLFT
jgi:starch synthase/alpha-amylase